MNCEAIENFIKGVTRDWLEKTEFEVIRLSWENGLIRAELSTDTVEHEVALTELCRRVSDDMSGFLLRKAEIRDRPDGVAYALEVLYTPVRKGKILEALKKANEERAKADEKKVEEN